EEGPRKITGQRDQRGPGIPGQRQRPGACRCVRYDNQCRVPRHRHAQLADADQRPKGRRQRQGVQRGVRAMSRSLRAAARWRLSRTAHSASETPDGAPAQLKEITDPTVSEEIRPEDSGDTALAESSPPEAAAFAPHPVSRRWSRTIALGVLPAISLM